MGIRYRFYRSCGTMSVRPKREHRAIEICLNFFATTSSNGTFVNYAARVKQCIPSLAHPSVKSTDPFTVHVFTSKLYVNVNINITELLITLRQTYNQPINQ
jgi:hypothetical protein